MKITIFSSLMTKEAEGVIDATEWIRDIRDGKFKPTVDQVRSMIKLGDKDRVRDWKMKLPAAVWAGECRKGRFFKHTTHGLCHLRLRRPARRPAPCRPSVPRGLPLDSCSPRHSIRTRAACGGKHRHRTHRCLPPGLRAGGRASARNHRSGPRHGLQGFRPRQPCFVRP